MMLRRDWLLLELMLSCRTSCIDWWGFFYLFNVLFLCSFYLYLLFRFDSPIAMLSMDPALSR
jgi:hypothetical protein